MGFLQILMNSASKSKNNLLYDSHLSRLDSRKGSAFVEISLTRTYNSKIRWLHTRLKLIFFTNWSDNDVFEPFFWRQPAFLRDHYQPFTGSHFATYIHTSFAASLSENPSCCANFEPLSLAGIYPYSRTRHLHCTVLFKWSVTSVK